MWNTQGKEEQSQMWSTHDLACAHCRARKIRCGRERPQCESCKRDGVECRYSSPGKRINHVKLLCQNFEALEDQLNSIQGDLSALTSLVKSGGAGRSLPVQGEEWVLEDFTYGDVSTGARKDRHIVRNEASSIDRYHGPCSLYTLCKEFHDDPVFQTPDPGAPAENNVAIQMLLEQMCTDASKEEHMDIPSEHSGICLPPRQFLNIVIGQFFKNADYATDLFVRSNFQVQLDRVYGHPLSPADEAWAVCFNVIVLLAIGKDQTTQSNSPFIQPFLQTLKMTVNNPRVFLAPRLVNVQALALLSHIAEQYSPPGFAEVVFAQACLLARTMGLHQPRASSNSLLVEESVEKQKVFRSLYIRDKNFAICRGSSSWLPTFDSSVSPLSDQVDGEEAKYGPRIELARIQDEIYRQFHSAEAPALPPSKHSHLLSKLEQRLEHWAATHQVIKKSTSSVEWANLTLSFFATRLCICRGSDDPRLAHLAYKDAKASCVLFLLATAPHSDPRLVEVLEQLLDRKLSASPLSMDNHNSEEINHVSLQSRAFECDENDAAAAAAALPRLTASFPLAAVFLVARNMALQPIAVPDALAARPEEEMQLLETLRDRFTAATDHDHIENLTQKLSRTLDTIVHIVRQKRFPEAATTPSMIFNDLSSLHSSASSGSQRSSAGGSRKATPPEPEAASTVTSAGEDMNTSSMLLPFMQPFDSPRSCSPWHTGANPAASAVVLSPWPASYKQQADSAGRVGKRPRLPSQTEMFDMTAAFAEHMQGHGQRPDEDPLSMFDFLAGGNDIPVFNAEE